MPVPFDFPRSALRSALMNRLRVPCGPFVSVTERVISALSRNVDVYNANDNDASSRLSPRIVLEFPPSLSDSIDPTA